MIDVRVFVAFPLRSVKKFMHSIVGSAMLKLVKVIISGISGDRGGPFRRFPFFLG